MSLLALQRDLRDWLRHDAAQAAARLGGETMPGLIVYQNNYRAQLMACLASACPQLRLWIGDEAFFAAAATHTDAAAPSDWTLDAYPAGFPATLAQIHADSPEIADLAWLEIALADAFVAADHAPLAPASLADLTWDDAVFLLSPALRLRDLGSNAPAIWSALSAGEEPPPAASLRQGEALLVWRSDFTACFRAIDALEASTLAAIAAGQPFGAVCAGLVAAAGEERGVALAGDMLGRWLRDGVIAGVRQAVGPSAAA